MTWTYLWPTLSINIMESWLSWLKQTAFMDGFLSKIYARYTELTGQKLKFSCIYITL